MLKRLAPVAFLVLALLYSPPAIAQFKPAFTVVKSVDLIDLKADGKYAQISERLFRVDTLKGINQMGEQRIDYNEKMESIELLEAYTLLPDGTKIDVTDDKIKRLDGDGSEEYSDGKVLAIIFPKVDVGSMLYYKTRSYQHTPYFPHHFFWYEHYSPHIAYENADVQLLQAPGIKMHFDSDRATGGTVELQPDDPPGSVRYRFTFKQDKVYPPESGQSALTDFAPYVAFSTFSNYAEFANSYQIRAKPMAEVTPAIAALAKELTIGVKDDSAKVRKLYDWVSKNIRYVAVYVAEGGFVPHPAQSTLDNRYGDCKDHVTLLEALLSAVGIESTTALVNSGDALRIPKLAISAPFNHAITYIPKLDLYLDSTSRFAPMGTLPDSVTAKPTLLTASGTKGYTPMNSWRKDYHHAIVKMALQKDGSVKGQSTWITHGVPEIAARAYQFGYKDRDTLDVINAILARGQETGRGEFLNNDPMDREEPWKIETIFSLDPIVNVPGPSAMTIPYGLMTDQFRRMASYVPPATRMFPAICSSLGFKHSLTLSFPRGMQVRRIPPNVKSVNGAYHYSASYKLLGQNLSVERSYASKRDLPTCSSRDDEDWNAFRAIIQRDLRGQVFIQ